MPPKKRQYKRRAIKKAKAVSTAVKQYVNRRIHSGRENKVFVDYGANQTITNAQTGLPTGRYLLPVISQGPAQNQRIGNEINIRYASISGIVNLLPYNGTTNPEPAPILVKMWIVSGKRQNTNNISLYDWTKWFEVGATNVPFQGNTLDMLLSHNREDFMVYATKSIRLGMSTDSKGSNPNNSYFDNSPMTQRFYFNLTKAMRKKLKYLDSSGTPTNSNLWIVFQAVNADGTTTGFQTCEFHYQTKVIYEDA